MNSIAPFCMCNVVLFFSIFGIVSAATTQPAATSQPVKVAVGPTGDAGSDLVVEFYRALLQEDPPTREQELAIFTPRSWLRMKLVLKPEDYEDEGTEPMTRTPAQKENYQRRMAKIDAAGPVVLEYLREHKDWFIPRHMQSANAISITSTSQVLCSLDHLKDPPRRGYGTVQVMFVADRTVPSDEMRLSILRFPVWDGKIAPGEISLDAHAGEMVAERFQRLAEAEQQ